MIAGRPAVARKTCRAAGPAGCHCTRTPGTHAIHHCRHCDHHWPANPAANTAKLAQIRAICTPTDGWHDPHADPAWEWDKHRKE